MISVTFCASVIFRRFLMIFEIFCDFKPAVRKNIGDLPVDHKQSRLKMKTMNRSL